MTEAKVRRVLFGSGNVHWMFRCFSQFIYNAFTLPEAKAGVGQGRISADRHVTIVCYLPHLSDKRPSSRQIKWNLVQPGRRGKQAPADVQEFELADLAPALRRCHVAVAHRHGEAEFAALPSAAIDPVPGRG